MGDKSVSLLPDEFRDKEDQAREEAKKNKKLPNFKMHVPGKNGQSDKKVEREEEKESWIKISEQEDKPQSRGKFRIFKKNEEPEKKITEPIKKSEPPRPQSKIEHSPIPKLGPIKVKPPRPKVVIPPKPKPMEPVKVEDVKDDKLRMRIPEKEIFKNGYSKKILKETVDKIEELKESNSLLDLFRKGKFLLKTPPAELNLIFEDYLKVINEQFWLRLRLLFTVMLVFVFLFSFGFIGLKFYKLNLIEDYNLNVELLAEKMVEINQLDEGQKEAKEMKERTVILQELLGNHLSWIKFFDFLEHSTINDVYYTNMAAESSGRVTLMARTNNYTNLAKQLVKFESSEFIEKVDITSGILNIEEIKSEEDELFAEFAPPTSELRYVEFIVDLELKEDSLIK